MNLFIIGNGFDLAHNLHTGYNCFRCWLLRQVAQYREEHINQSLTIPEAIKDNHGEDVISNEVETENFLLQILENCPDLDEKWNTLEDSLYSLDLQDAFDEDNFFSKDNAMDKDGILHYAWLDEQYRSSIKNLRINIQYLKKLFSIWINSVSIFATPRFALQELMTRDDVYISFNYTETLEKIYDIPSNRIYHIHGLRWSKYTKESHSYYESGNLIIGHGRRETKEFDGMPEVVADEATKIIEDLRKPTTQIIEKYEELWSMLSAVDSVYGYGFSYSRADLPYVEKICQMLDESIVWHLHTYDDARNKENENSIRGCGFKGKFGRFSA